MSTFTHEQHSLMKDKLSQAIKDYAYRLKRYKINYSIAMGHTLKEDIDLSRVSDYIRETDRFIILNHNTYAVVFDCTDETTGMQAAKNLLTHFQGAASLYTSIVTASHYEVDSMMIQELFSLLYYAVEHKINNITQEHSQRIQKH